MTAFSIACPAKLNLFLRIVAREPSGYHQIETLFQAVGLHDRVEAHPGGDGIALEVRPGHGGSGPGDRRGGGEDRGALGGGRLDAHVGDLGDPADNTVVRAARLFHDATGIDPGVRLVLAKAIPAGTGLGGASSDAAGTLRVLNALHGHPLRRHQIIRLGARIGSDVPFFCAGATTSLAWGRGDRLLGRPAPPPAHVVLAVPRARTSTANAYREASAKLKLPVPPRWLGDIGTGDWKGLARLQQNDFELVAFERVPELRALREALVTGGAVMARLTGSGSALFGVFADQERARRAADEAGAMEGVAAAFVVPTLNEMPAVRRIGRDGQSTRDSMSWEDDGCGGASNA